MDTPHRDDTPAAPTRRARRFIALRELALQLIVVFVGLLAALQVDGWKEDRDRRQTERVYLRRLHDDLTDYLGWLDKTLPFLEAHRRAVQHVSDSFVANRVLNDDSALFEAGILFVGHLPSLSRPSSAFNEMVATGVFARLDSLELQRSVTRLFATQATVDANFAWWRGSVLELETRLQPHIEYYEDEGGRAPSPQFATGSDGQRVRYDFATLRGMVEIRNGYFAATDTHSDWVEWTSLVRDQAREADAIVTRELQRRGG